MEAPYKRFSLLNTSDHIKLINLRQQDREKMLEISINFFHIGIILRPENNSILINILVTLSKSYKTCICY